MNRQAKEAMLAGALLYETLDAPRRVRAETLLRNAAALFRKYEAQGESKRLRFVARHSNGELRKHVEWARVNREMADAIEEFLK